MTAISMGNPLVTILAIAGALLLGWVLFQRYGGRGAAVQALIGVLAAVFWMVSFAFQIQGSGSRIGLLIWMVALSVAFYLYQSNKQTLEEEEDVDLRVRYFG